jgi:hypothetical protein
MVQDKKTITPFHTHISNFKIVEYINNDSLDLRLSNLKEFGSVEEIKKVKKAKDMTYKNQSLHFKYADDPWTLPKNIWILGKPTGTVFIKDGVYHSRVPHDGRIRSKTFPKTKEGKQAAEKWKIETSYKLGMTRNLIKILDHEYIEVQLTREKTTKTNIELLPLIQKVYLCATIFKGTPYVSVSRGNYNKLYHNMITGFNMVDHINGNTLDNTFKNLRWCDFSLNNSNRHTKEKDSNQGNNIKIVHRDTETSQGYLDFRENMYMTRFEKRFNIPIGDTGYAIAHNKLKKYKHFIRTGEIDPFIVDIVTKTDLDKRKQYYKWLITKTKFTNTDSHLKNMGLSELQRHDINQTIAIWQHKYLNSLYKKAK